MADATDAKSAASAAAERLARARPRVRRPSGLSVRHDARLEGAGEPCSTAPEADEHLDALTGNKRERSNEVAIGDTSAATASSDRHVADDPCDGTTAPLRPCRGLILSRGCASQVPLGMTAGARF